MHKVFVYGTLKSDTPKVFQVSHYLEQQHFRKATIPGQLFLIPGVGVCFPAVKVEDIQEGDIVHGEVVEFEHEEILEALDHIEGVQKEGSMYDRVKVVATLEDGTMEEVWAYVWVDDPEYLKYKIEHGNFEIFGFQEQPENEGDEAKYRKGYPLQDPSKGEDYTCFIEQDESFGLFKIPGKNDGE